MGFGLVHTTLVVVSGCFGVFQDVSGSAVKGHDRVSSPPAPAPGAGPSNTVKAGAAVGEGRPRLASLPTPKLLPPMLRAEGRPPV